jgi:hypothetical protein
MTVATTAVILGVAQSVSAVLTEDAREGALGALLALAGAALWWSHLRFGFKRASVAILQNRRDRPSFLHRNRDEILVAAMVGAALTLLARLLT